MLLLLLLLCTRLLWLVERRLIESRLDLVCTLCSLRQGLFLFFSCWQDERDKSGSLVAGRVTLKSVSVEAEGTYKCEVSTEAPVFDTDYKEANLTIIGQCLRL